MRGCRGEGRRHTAGLGHAHGAGTRAIAALATPAGEGRATGGGGCQGHTSASVRCGAVHAGTADALWTTRHGATTHACLAYGQSGLLEREGRGDAAGLSHAHRARARATAALTTPAGEG